MDIKEAVLSLDTNVKDWYSKKFRSDELKDDIRADVTFKDINDALGVEPDIYKYIFGDPTKGDSIVRERIFSALSDILGVDYEEVYDRWLDTPDPEVDDMVDKITQLRASRNDESVEEELNFDREAACDWCGKTGKVAVTHYGTSHYNRLVCPDCAKEMNIKESKKLNETGEWEDDEEGLAWKEALVNLVKKYTEGIKGFEFDDSDVNGFDKYQGPYINTEMGTIWSDGERDDSFIVEYGNAYYRISSREDAEDLAGGKLNPLQEDYSARQSKFYPSLDNRRTDDVTPDNIKWLEANSPDIENARSLIAQAYDILKPLHYNSKVVYALGEALGMIDMDLELIQPKEGETTECLNQPDPFANASESVESDPEVATIKESAMFGEEAVEDKTDYAKLLEKYYGADAVKLAEENELSAKSVFFFMECHATLDPVVALKEELMEDFNKEEFNKLYD